MSRVFSRFRATSAGSKEGYGVDEARRGRCRIKSGAKLSPWMQLQWLRYVSICRPVERHQFIIIALNRPAPCTPTPYHSILPSIVQFRFYAVAVRVPPPSRFPSGPLSIFNRGHLISRRPARRCSNAPTVRVARTFRYVLRTVGTIKGTSGKRTEELKKSIHRTLGAGHSVAPPQLTLSRSLVGGSWG